MTPRELAAIENAAMRAGHRVTPPDAMPAVPSDSDERRILDAMAGGKEMTAADVAWRTHIAPRVVAFRMRSMANMGLISRTALLKDIQLYRRKNTPAP